MSAVSIALVYPDLLGTYGDGGNAVVLAERLRRRGHEADVVTVASGQPVPDSCDIYVIGGGEDLPQALAAARLASERPLHRAVESGAVVLAICAGLQILGESFVAPDGEDRPGLGLLGCVTRAGTRPRAIGEVLVQPSAEWVGEGLAGPLTGFENHGAVTELKAGTGTHPVGTVVAGVGNHDGSVEGAVKGRVWGTYLHGPVLARNPRLADLLLRWVVGDLAPFDDTEAEALHAERTRNGPRERRIGGVPAEQRRILPGLRLRPGARRGDGRWPRASGPP
ncbi:MAG TPA: hypothetical protein VME46_14200 [Acidimicrobiales bacterium]|nr:hypothetical protein [Acidimicrobiales bacterium]